jgi:hypothetical protein
LGKLTVISLTSVVDEDVRRADRDREGLFVCDNNAALTISTMGRHNAMSLCPILAAYERGVVRPDSKILRFRQPPRMGGCFSCRARRHRRPRDEEERLAGGLDPSTALPPPRSPFEKAVDVFSALKEDKYVLAAPN